MQRGIDWLATVLAVILCSGRCEAQFTACDNIDEEIPVHRLSTKTSYFNAEKDKSHWKQFGKEVEGCMAKQVWLLSRHGTRYPTENDIHYIMDNLPIISQQVVDNHKNSKGCLSEKNIEQFQSWFPSYGFRDKEQLHEMGQEELAYIGEYWRTFLPHLFNTTFNPDKFKIDFTVKNRTGQSAYHFLRGMFGEDAIGNIELPEPYSPNFVLRFYKACPRWLKEVYKNNETTYKERHQFTQTEEFKNMVTWVSSRLGFTNPLSTGELEAIYDECRYETAWWPHRRSLWCAPFTSHDLEVMEFYSDLKYYYEDSYGHPLNLETACYTLDNLYKYFRTTVTTGKAKPQGIFYFAHDKTIMKVMAMFGMYRPQEHLRHDNFKTMRDRIWRTSFVSPFSSNLAFVLYRCGSKNPWNYKVGTFVQGQPTPLPELCGELLCQWEELLPWLESNHATCDLNKLCMLHDEL